MEIILGVLILVFTLSSIVARCPEKEIIYPCICETIGVKSFVTCEGLDNEADFLNAIKPAVGRGSLFSITFIDLLLNYIPSDAFDGLSLEMLEFVNSNFMALTDNEVAFEGNEYSLHTLKVSGNTFMSTWSWSELKNLRNLHHLIVSFGDLDDIEKVDGGYFKNLEVIHFIHQKLTFLEDETFMALINARSIKLHNNQLSKLKRSMFPYPAQKLNEIDLSYNKIETLPDDFFSNMPIMLYVNLAHNNIMFFSEPTFYNVFNQVISFDISGNDLHCDCRIKWTLYNAVPYHLNATCSQPPELKGTHVADLFAHQLPC